MGIWRGSAWLQPLWSIRAPLAPWYLQQQPLAPKGRQGLGAEEGCGGRGRLNFSSSASVFCAFSFPSAGGISAALCPCPPWVAQAGKCLSPCPEGCAAVGLQEQHSLAFLQALHTGASRPCSSPRSPQGQAARNWRHWQQGCSLQGPGRKRQGPGCVRSQPSLEQLGRILPQVDKETCPRWAERLPGGGVPGSRSLPLPLPAHSLFKGSHLPASASCPCPLPA